LRNATEAAPVAEPLADVPRPGAPATFTPEQIRAIVASACEQQTQACDLPLSHWSRSDSRDVPSRAVLSRASQTARPGAFLKEAALQPHRVWGWLTSKPDPELDTKCADICAVYLQAPALAEQGARTASIDKMSGVQALESAAPSLPMTSGKASGRSTSTSVIARRA
jgi:hypothetical protein